MTTSESLRKTRERAQALREQARRTREKARLVAAATRSLWERAQQIRDKNKDAVDDAMVRTEDTPRRSP